MPNVGMHVPTDASTKQKAGPRVAAILSIVETCRTAYPPDSRLSAGSPAVLADFPIARVAELTPRALATPELAIIFLDWVGWLNGYEESVISTILLGIRC